MKHSYRASQFALVAIFSVGFGLILYYVTGFNGFAYFLLFSIISTLLLSIVYLLRRRLGLIRKREAFRSSLMRSLNAILYYRESGLPLLHSIEKVADLSELKELKESLSNLSKKIRLGQAVGNSITFIEGLKTNGLEMQEIKSVLVAYEIELKERVSAIEAHSQRHATISMFLSTILPSFVIFAFVGSSIISGSAPSLTAFALAMLVILPIVYAVSNVELGKISIEGNRKEKKEVLLLAKRILSEMERGLRIKVAVEKVGSSGGDASSIYLLLRKHLLGQMKVNTGNKHNPYAAELEELVAFGLNTGRSIRKSLSLFCKRLEYEIESENRLNAKTGGMRTLTYAGLLFFLPLFGGISASILGTTLSLLSGQVALLQQHFLIIIALYATMILLVSAVLGNPLSGILKNVYSVLPLAAGSISVLLLTAHYATEIL